MKISTDLISSLSRTVLSEPAYNTEVEVPPMIVPVISLRQRAAFLSNAVGVTFKSTFLNDTNLNQGNSAGSTTVAVILNAGLWKLDWSYQTFRNFLGVDGDRFSAAFSYDGGANWIAFARSDNFAAGVETHQRGEFTILVTTPNLQIVNFLPTSVGVGNQVRSHMFMYGQLLA